MKYLMKKTLQLFCEQSGIFPAKCTDLHRWEQFAEDAPRSAVEKVYRFWNISADLDEENAQKIERILRYRLFRLEYPRLKMNFINAHKDKILWVRSDWSAEDIFSYMSWEKCSAKYPFYVVDEQNKVRGIAIEKGFIFAGALNFAMTVDEAEYFYKRCALKPLTEKEVELLRTHNSALRQMMSAVGMQQICGRYLIVDATARSWCSEVLNKRLPILREDAFGGCFLLAKL